MRPRATVLTTWLRSFCDSHLNLLFRNSFWTLLAQTVTIGAGFAKVVILARALGPSLYGQLVFLTAFITFVQQVFDLNLSQSIIRYGHLYTADSQSLKWQAFLKALYISAAIICVLFLLTMTILLFGSRAFGEAPLEGSAKLVLSLLFLSISADLFVSQLAGLLKLKYLFREIAAVEVSAALLEVLILVAVAVMLPLSVTSVLAVITAAATIRTLLIAWLLRKRIPELKQPWFKASLAPLKSDWKEIATFTGENSVSRTIKSLYGAGDVVLLNWVAPAHVVGFYGAAKKLGLSVALVTQPLLSTIYTQLAHLVAEKKTDIAWRLAMKVTLIGFLLALPVLFGLALFRSEVVDLILGPKFHQAKNLLIWLALLGFVRAIFFWTNGLLLSLGLSRYRLVWDALTVLIWFVLAMTLLPLFGAGMAIAAAALVAQIVRELVVIRRSRLEIKQRVSESRCMGEPGLASP